MSYQHANLAAGKWRTMPLVEQLANVGSEVGRVSRWKEKDLQACEKAFTRALELLDLTIQDPRWQGRRKELTRVREVLCDAMSGGSVYGSDLAGLDQYFLHFAVAARSNR
ncbi:MAG: hypothetical protein OEY80_11165 [Nitrospirota bacterium]|nr:hypothetical protein [Nitrospirota bacterium]MDH4360968.1 hypothetical protein [Nitrospirota bacterium]MDH5576035.1 hypothetical protein [Nitrospirota bacterium]